MSLFFFFKQKTAYEMRISDWSSDVCSSDLHVAGPRVAQQRAFGVFGQALAVGQEVPRQRQDVARACAERRQAQFDAVEAVEQVLAEAAVGDQRGEVGVGRADDAHRDAALAVAAQEFEAPGLPIGRAAWRERGCQYV